MAKQRNRSAVARARDAALETIKASAGGSLLGAFVFSGSTSGWTAPGDDVRRTWGESGLDPSVDLCDVPDHESSLNRALAASGSHAKGFDCTLKPLDELRPDGTRVVIVAQWRQNGSAHADPVGTIVLPPGKRCHIETPDPHGIAERITDLAHDRYLGRYTANDLRAAYVRILDRWQAAPALDDVSGNHDPHWMPAAGIPTIQKLQGVVKLLGSGKVGYVEIHDSPANRATSIAAAKTGLETRLAAFKKKAVEWKAGLNLPSRASTVERTLEEAQELLATGDLYRAILRDEVLASLETEIAGLKVSYREIALGIEASEASGDTA